jgi:hypothetical protein
MSSASRDNADWGLTVERAACERWQLEHIASDPAAPDWFDARATAVIRGAKAHETEFGAVVADTAIEVKAARFRVEHNGSQRRGLWWLRESSHRRLLAADGEYALGVYTPVQGVLALILRPAWWVEHRISCWSSCGDDHRADRAARIPWSRVFDTAEVAP